MVAEAGLERQVYMQLLEKGERLQDAVSGVAENKAYFDSGDVADYMSGVNTSEVGKMLESLRKLDILDAFNPESSSTNTYIADNYRPDWFSEFLDEPKRFAADIYRSKGFGRSEAAESLSEFTEWSPATYNSKFTEWDLRFGGHPEELREEILEEVRGYEQRTRATEELAEEYEEVSPRTIDNWIDEEGLYFDPTEEEREVVRNEMGFFSRAGFPRNYSRETVSYLREVPESTINDWIAGEVLFGED